MYCTFCKFNNERYNGYVLNNIINYFLIFYLLYLLYLIILGNNFAKQTIKGCNEITIYFKRSHFGGSLLANAATILNIQGGLKTYCETRWTSMYEAAASILNFRIALEYVNIFKFFLFFFL